MIKSGYAVTLFDDRFVLLSELSNVLGWEMRWQLRQGQSVNVNDELIDGDYILKRLVPLDDKSHSIEYYRPSYIYNSSFKIDNLKLYELNFYNNEGGFMEANGKFLSSLNETIPLRSNIDLPPSLTYPSRVRFSYCKFMVNSFKALLMKFDLTLNRENAMLKIGILNKHREPAFWHDPSRFEFRCGDMTIKMTDIVELDRNVYRHDSGRIYDESSFSIKDIKFDFGEKCLDCNGAGEIKLLNSIQKCKCQS